MTHATIRNGTLWVEIRIKTFKISHSHFDAVRRKVVCEEEAGRDGSRGERRKERGTVRCV